MTLHVINKSPAKSSAIEEYIAVSETTNAENALLLIEDAVYLAVKKDENTALLERINALTSSCYILKEDLSVRGLSLNLVDGFTVVDYAGFVQLSLEHDKIQSWV